MIRAAFARKAVCIEELKNLDMSKEYLKPVVITRVIELPTDEYLNFTANLPDDYDFIKQNLELMYESADGVWHCIYVKEIGSNAGVLLESEGYDYARYASFYSEEKTDSGI